MTGLDALHEYVENDLYEKVEIPCDCMDGCQFLTELTDPYATGDLPSEYNCSATPEECPVVSFKINNIIKGI